MEKESEDKSSGEYPEVYAKALEILRSYVKPGMHEGLDNIKALCDELGNPQENFKAVQIAGTNGKTSTSRFSAAILQDQGVSTALYTSPELAERRERMEIAGEVSSYEDFGQAVVEAYDADLSARKKFPEMWSSLFEVCTAAAFMLFSDKKVECAVLEVGLGGRWDATSIKYADVSCITGIGLDHVQILGNTLEEIAGEKAAVIRKDAPVVFGTGTAITKSVEKLLIERAIKVGAPFYFVREEGNFSYNSELTKENTVVFKILENPEHIFDELSIEVKGIYDSYQVSKIAPSYQAQNIACAIAVSEQYLGQALDKDRLQDSIKHCRVPGRFDVFRKNPLAMVDACHNPQSVEVFLSSLVEVFPNKKDRPDLLLAVLADKDVEGIIRDLSEEFESISVTQTQSYRALDYKSLANKVEEISGKRPKVFASVAEALDFYEERAFIACGSITLGAEIARLVK